MFWNTKSSKIEIDGEFHLTFFFLNHVTFPDFKRSLSPLSIFEEYKSEYFYKLWT